MERYEIVELQKTVAAEFDALRDDRFHVINGARSADDVHGDVRAIVAAVLARRDAGELPLLDLWQVGGGGGNRQDGAAPVGEGV